MNGAGMDHINHWIEVDGLWAYRPAPVLDRAREAADILDRSGDPGQKTAAMLLRRLADAREHLVMDMPAPVLDAADALADAVITGEWGSDGAMDWVEDARRYYPVDAQGGLGVNRMLDAIDDLLRLHTMTHGFPAECSHCRQSWPCSTVGAIEFRLLGVAP